jgi:hypothetical protein
VPSEIFDFLYGTLGITRTVETNIPVSRSGARAILSAKYYFENAEISKNRTYYNGEGTEGYVYLDTQDGFDIFENQNFIPMGFTYDYYITESEWEDLDASKHDLDLSRVLIISDKDALKYGDHLSMLEATAEDLLENEMSSYDLELECDKRAATSCTSFETDTYGFTAKTAMLKDNTLVFFSVPNTEGFSCKVDGVETEILTADYGLMAIPVSGGVHEIRVTYEPEGLKGGLLMSIAGILILGVYGFGMLKYIKKND